MFEPQVPAVSFSSDSLRVSFKGDQAVWDRLRKARVPPPLPPHTHRTALGCRGCRTQVPGGSPGLSPLSKAVVGQNMALDTVAAYMASSSMPTYFLPSQLIQLHFLQMYPNVEGWNVF